MAERAEKFKAAGVVAGGAIFESAAVGADADVLMAPFVEMEKFGGTLLTFNGLEIIYAIPQDILELARVFVHAGPVGFAALVLAALGGAAFWKAGQMWQNAG